MVDSAGDGTEPNQELEQLVRFVRFVRFQPRNAKDKCSIAPQQCARPVEKFHFDTLAERMHHPSVNIHTVVLRKPKWDN